MQLQTRIALLGVLLITAPVIAFAAFSSPSELLAAIHFKNQPLNVSYDAHLEMDEFIASAWLKGQVQSDSNLDDIKANVKLTVDVAMRGEKATRFSSQIRIVDGMVYVRLQNVEEARFIAFAHVDSNTWYAVPLQKTATEKLAKEGLSEDDAKKILSSLINALFGMTKQTNGTIVTYSLQPKPTAAKEVAAVLNGIDDEHITSAKITASQIQTYLQKVNLHIKVVTSMKDQPKMVKFYASYTDDLLPVHVVLQGTSTLRNLPLNVSKPPSPVVIDTTTSSSSSSVSWTDFDARNAQRRADVNTILNASYQYAIDHDGNLPAGITLTPTEICATDATSCAGKVDLDTLTGSYVVRLPRDPQVKTGNGTNYFISQDQTEHLTVSAKGAEDGLSISVSR